MAMPGVMGLLREERKIACVAALPSPPTEAEHPLSTKFGHSLGSEPR